MEVGAKTGADYGEKSWNRQAQRNGYRDFDWQTRAANVELRISKLRSGSFFPPLLEPRRTVEKALTAVIQEAYLHGVSTRAMDEFVQAMGGRIVSVAVIIAVSVNTDGRREVLGMSIGSLEAETYWTDFLREPVRRRLRGVALAISDAYEGIKALVARVLNSIWQRRRAHFQRNALAHARKSSRRVVSAFIATALAQPDRATAKRQWRHVADQIRGKLSKLAALLDDAEEGVLAYMTLESLSSICDARLVSLPVTHHG